MLSVKKKKKTKIGVFLAIFLVGGMAHYWLSLTRVITKNYGISFGLDGWFFIVLSIFFVVMLSIIWWKNEFRGINVILAGGWINLIDRVVFGYVRDYWKLGSIYNNLADWMIQVGVIIFLSKIWIKKSK